jgi:hypothetical protein
MKRIAVLLLTLVSVSGSAQTAANDFLDSLGLAGYRNRSCCGNVEARVWCGFPSFVGRATTPRKDSAAGPTERHFHSLSEPSNSAHFVQMSSSDNAEDENSGFWKAA